MLLLAFFASIFVGLFFWHRTVTLNNPGKWPTNLALPRHVGLVKRYLSSKGWTLGDGMPWMNIFIQGTKNDVWLSLVIHSEQSLSLPTLLRECIDRRGGPRFVVGILSTISPPSEILEQACQNGVFFMTPEQLADAETHVRNAKATEKKRLADLAGQT